MKLAPNMEDRETCTPERAALTKSTTPSFDAVSLSSITETYMPKNAAAPFQNDESGDAQLLGEALSDTAGQVKDKVAVLGRSAADKVDEHRDAAASGLDKRHPPSTIRPKAYPAARRSPASPMLRLIA